MSFKIYYISTFDLDYSGSFESIQKFEFLIWAWIDHINICWSMLEDMCNWILELIKLSLSQVPDWPISLLQSLD